MKNCVLSSVLAICILSCNTNQKKQNLTNYKPSTLKSDILIETVAEIPFSKSNKIDEVTLTVSGKSVLKGTATFKVRNDIGEEVYCESFPAKKLIQPEYKTANTVLQEVHIKEVVEGYFVEGQSLIFNDSLSYVSS